MTTSLISHREFRGQRISKHRLDNGLSVIVVPDDRAPIVSVQSWFGVGSRDEKTGRTGIAHFFEHLMFTGTSRYPSGALDRTIESVGGDTNAATWVDWTFYRISVPSASIDLALDLESDRISNLALTSEIIESERQVVLNERRERVDDDVDGFLDEQLAKLTFPDHPYGWPTIGWQQDIEALKRTDLVTFYETYYSPGQATLVIVGDIDETRCVDLVHKYYGSLASPGSRPSPPASVATRQTTQTRLEFRKPIQSERVLVGFRAPPQTHPDWVALTLLSELVSGGPSSRLYRKLVIDDEVAVSTSCAVLPFALDSIFEVAGTCCPGIDADTVLDAVFKEFENIANNGIPDSELAKGKRCLLTDFWSDWVSCDGKAEALGHAELVCGDFRNVFAHAEHIANVTGDDLQRVANKYLDRDRANIVVGRSKHE